MIKFPHKDVLSISISMLPPGVLGSPSLELFRQMQRDTFRLSEWELYIEHITGLPGFQDFFQLRDSLIL